ncbi:cyclopropane-fatty-acyl-phospholipid synthase family protein [Sorangium sp. So ce269]
MNTVDLKELGASASAVQYHYDVGNDFYDLWLDKETKSYSAALFEDGPADTLEAAQVRKVDYHATQARVPAGGRVLDIGCGWGNFLRRAVEVHGAARGVGLSLSREQTAAILKRQDPRVEVLLESWVDHVPEAPYDAIVSIEAIEAFVRYGVNPDDKRRVYRALFERCHEWLRPGGSMCWQMIAYGNTGPEDFDNFVAKEIFPESDLPLLEELAAAVHRRFEIVVLRNDRLDYARTLRTWLERLKANRKQAAELAGEEVLDRYERYLRLSEFMFTSGNCDLYRITLRRIDRPRDRLSRPGRASGVSR